MRHTDERESNQIEKNLEELAFEPCLKEQIYLDGHVGGENRERGIRGEENRTRKGLWVGPRGQGWSAECVRLGRQWRVRGSAKGRLSRLIQ